jgi:hypothetical protein
MHNAQGERISGIADYAYQVRGDVAQDAVHQPASAPDQTSMQLIFIYLAAAVTLGLLITAMAIVKLKHSRPPSDVIH